MHYYIQVTGYIYLHVCVSISVHVCLLMCVFVCVHVFACICVSACMYVCVCMYMCVLHVCLSVHVCVYVSTHYLSCDVANGSSHVPDRVVEIKPHIFMPLVYRNRGKVGYIHIFYIIKLGHS